MMRAVLRALGEAAFDPEVLLDAHRNDREWLGQFHRVLVEVGRFSVIMGDKRTADRAHRVERALIAAARARVEKQRPKEAAYVLGVTYSTLVRRIEILKKSAESQ
jgi:hypothetical protein